MTDPFDPLREIRPDRLQPADPGDPAAFTRAKDQLMSQIADGTMVEPLTTPDVYPRLAYNDELAAVEYLTRVFGFGEVREARLEFDGKYLCWLRLGTGLVMVSHSTEEHRIHSPGDVGRASVMMNVYVPDVDAHYANAVAQGAEITAELQDLFYGERRYEASDPEGHRWHFTERFDSIVARDGRAPEPVEPPG